MNWSAVVFYAWLAALAVVLGVVAGWGWALIPIAVGLLVSCAAVVLGD
jgi:hypothetical protein